MTRDVSGRRLFSLNDALAIASLVVACGAIAGAVGGYFVLQYRVQQTEVAQRELATSVAENTKRDADRDVLIAKTVERLNGLTQTLADIRRKE